MSTRWLAFAALSSCISPPGPSLPANPPPSVRHTIGGPCRHDNDCVAGAACNWFTCDFRAPCNVSITDNLGNKHTRRHRFDDRGRELGFDEITDGEVITRETWTWSDDGRVSTTKAWLDTNDPEPTFVTTRTRATDGLVSLQREVTHGVVTETTYTWSDSWTCRTPRLTVRGEGGALIRESHAQCDADGLPIKVEEAKGTDVAIAWTYKAKGKRVHERTRRFAPPADPMPVRLVFERDTRGAVVGVSVDNFADGSIDVVEVYDLTCWQEEAEAIRYRPSQ